MTNYFIQKVRKDEKDNIISVKTKYNEFSTSKAVSMIESRQDKFFVGEKTPVGIYTRAGIKYLRSHADGYWNNNLDNLPLF